MSDVELSEVVYYLRFEPAELRVFLAEHPDVEVDLFKIDGWTALHEAASKDNCESVNLLLDHRADIHARLTHSGDTALMLSIKYTKAYKTPLLLLERKADVHVENGRGESALYHSLLAAADTTTFLLLCCGADARNIATTYGINQARVDAAIANYESAHAFIEHTHQLIVTTLSDKVQVDTRVGRDDVGIYHEPLERTLEYLGLSMSAVQVINTSIDGNEHMRVLIPNQPRIAKHWYKKWEKLQELKRIEKGIEYLLKWIK
jgi:hypothetical protein